MKDHLVKAIAEGVRIYAAVTTSLVNEAMKRHDCYPVAAAALGRTMTGALLMAANLKEKEAITLKFDGHGPLGKVVADATPEGFVRGYVTHPHVDLPLNDRGKIDVGSGVGTNGMLTVTRFTGMKTPISGSVNIIDGEIADDLIHYLYESEQTPSSVGLGVLVGSGFRCLGAGGFILQPMPDASEEIIQHLENNLKSIHSVSQMVEQGMDAQEMIQRILDGFNITFLTHTELAFRCHCSKKRIEDTLRGLRSEDLDALISDGKAEVVCQFCGEKYHFSRQELEAIKKMRSSQQKIE